MKNGSDVQKPIVKGGGGSETPRQYGESVGSATRTAENYEFLFAIFLPFMSDSWIPCQGSMNHCCSHWCVVERCGALWSVVERCGALWSVAFVLTFERSVLSRI
jgi:hypothetical protein